MRSALCALACVSVFACSDSEAPGADGGSRADADLLAPGADASIAPDAGAVVESDAGAVVECSPGTRYSAGERWFQERTELSGLLGVEGIRLSTVDVDGDGFADLLVRAGGNAPDDFGPEGVRRTWLMRNQGGEGFEDITLRSRLRALRDPADELGRPGEVVAFGDIDNDGDLDLYTGLDSTATGLPGGATSELMLNDGRGNFSFGPIDSLVRNVGGVDVVAGASFVDVDRDGVLDLFLAHNGYSGGQGAVILPDRLLLGNGDGSFREGTAAFGLLTREWALLADLDAGLAHSRAWSAAACDLNGDGWPELLASSYGRAPNLLWQADGTGAGYLNRAVASGYAFDEDQEWRDNQFARCYCQANRQAPDCAAVPAPLISCSNNWNHDQDRRPFRLGGNSGTTVCADLNNDGALDLLTTEITHWWAGRGSDRSGVLFNTGAPDVSFERPAEETVGLTRVRSGVSWDQGDMTAAVLDFDNDGWPDLYLGASDYPGNRGLLYHQVGPGRFAEVPIEDFFEHNRSHGIAVADFDRDGDLDLILGHSRARCDASQPNDCYPTRQVRYFENVRGQDGHWLQLHLVGGPGTNRAAIGARVRVSSGGVTQTQEVGGGHGHYGIQHDLVLHFGLGAGCEAEVEVRWPDASLTRESFRLESGRRYRVVQGEPPVPLSD